MFTHVPERRPEGCSALFSSERLLMSCAVYALGPRACPTEAGHLWCGRLVGAGVGCRAARLLCLGPWFLFWWLGGAGWGKVCREPRQSPWAVFRGPVQSVIDPEKKGGSRWLALCFSAPELHPPRAPPCPSGFRRLALACNAAHHSFPGEAVSRPDPHLGGLTPALTLWTALFQKLLVPGPHTPGIWPLPGHSCSGPSSSSGRPHPSCPLGGPVGPITSNQSSKYP